MFCPKTFNIREQRCWWNQNTFAKSQTYPFQAFAYEIMQNIQERLKWYRKSFETILLIGSLPLEKFLTFSETATLFLQFCSDKNLKFRTLNQSLPEKTFPFCSLRGEFPCALESVDLIISINDFNYIAAVQQYLKNIYPLLKPKGVFINAFPGEQSFQELRTAMAFLENIFMKGISPRVFPTISLKDASLMIQETPFYAPVIDIDRHKIYHPNFSSLLTDLRFWGGTNILNERYQKMLPKKFLKKLEEFYSNNFIDSKGVTTTIEIIYQTVQKKG